VRVVVHPDAEAAARAAADMAAGLIREAIAAQGRAAFVAATGVSQLAVLAHLVAAPGIAWERTTLFHLDEYIGFPADHPASFRRYLRERLTSRVPIGTAHFIQGDAPDLGAELARLNGILAATPIDAAFVGVGENAHLAFNDPPADFTAEEPYLVVELEEACRRQQLGEGWFASLAEVPRRAISMSVRQILKAREILCIVPDARKAEAVRDCLDGPVSPLHPSSILQTHPRATLYLDRDSASLSKRAASASGRT
jgi:glucosamine-6-phosphate deaminase